MNARIQEVELNDVDLMREDGPTALNLPVQATLQDVFSAPICSELSKLFRLTLNGPITEQRRAELTIGHTLHAPDLAPQWLGVLMALDTHVILPGSDDPDMRLDAYLALPDADRPDVAAIRLPLNVPGRMWCEMHVVPMPAAGSAITAMAVIDLNADQTVRCARLALTGVWSDSVRLSAAAHDLVGKVLDAAAIDRVAAAVAHEVETIGIARNGTVAQVANVTRAALTTCKNGNC